MRMTDRAAERRLRIVRGRARAASEKIVPPNVQAYLKGEPIADEAAPRGADGLGPRLERRRCRRKAMRSEALVRRVGGFNFDVPLQDISSGGCRVEMLEPCGIGDSLITRFPHLEPLGSRVCWAEGTTTGVQFLTSIHPAVFDMLLSRLSEDAVAA
jgi:PilZ domain